MISKEKLLQAVEDGILDEVKDMAKMEAVNEASETGEQAETQFGRGLRLALDAYQRACAEVDKLP